MSFLKTKALAAVSFSGCGWLLGFHLGTSNKLLQHELVSKQTVLAGVSGGAIMAAALASNVDIQLLKQLYQNEGEKLRATGGWRRGQITETITSLAHQIIPEDAAERSRGRLHIGVARPPSRAAYSMKFELVSDFKSNSDLIEVKAICSTY